MQTVNFQCGHCGKLMAVAADFLGQQVRCPHCQQVVVAPSPAPAPAPFSLEPGAPQVLPPGPAGPGPDEPLFKSLSTGDAEDIFSNPASSDDLFGRADAPRLEMPHEPAPAPAPAPGTPTEELSYTAPADGSGALPVESTFLTNQAPEGVLAGVGTALTDTPVSAPETEAVLPSAPLRRPRPSSGGGAFLPLVFIPLCLYAILATVAVVLLLMRQQQEQPSIFDRMPDINGDHPGVKKTGALIQFDKRRATGKLPEHLITDLGEPLTVGDLEVTPLRVERKRVAIRVAGFDKAERCAADSLVLTLKLRNLAGDYRFTPLDNFFDRRWQEQGTPPLTILQVGDHFCFGGPAEWFPRGDARHRREWVEGRKDTDPEGLGPGKEMTSFVCTDGGKESPSACARLLFGLNEEGKQVKAPYQGPLLWRVHVRRGLVSWRGKQVPATAVIGVRFSSTAYQRTARGACRPPDRPARWGAFTNL
jgi:hypothetical protein